MKTVLVVEDDKFLTNAYSQKLAREGFSVILAQDVNKSLELLRQSVPDIILLDIVMPGKSGLVLLEELKKHDSWKKIPVIICSNLDTEAYREKIDTYGVQDYIIKSNISLDQLVKKIHTHTS